jgi:cell division protein FtsL
MKMKKNKKKVTKLESFLYKIASIVLIALIIGIVFGETALAKANLEVQYLKNEVEEKENTNTSLIKTIK